MNCVFDLWYSSHGVGDRGFGGRPALRPQTSGGAFTRAWRNCRGFLLYVCGVLPRMAEYDMPGFHPFGLPLPLDAGVNVDFGADVDIGIGTKLGWGAVVLYVSRGVLSRIAEYDMPGCHPLGLPLPLDATGVDVDFGADVDIGIGAKFGWGAVVLYVCGGVLPRIAEYDMPDFHPFSLPSPPLDTSGVNVVFGADIDIGMGTKLGWGAVGSEGGGAATSSSLARLESSHM